MSRSRAFRPALRHALARNPPRVTPAQRRARSSIGGLKRKPERGLARALVTLRDRGGPPYTLRFHRELPAGDRIVTRLAGS
jgi:hypothetical protein